MAHNPSERDDSLPAEPSSYGETTRKMREAGGKALLAAAPELEGIVGPSSAKCIAAEVFRAMIKMREEVYSTPRLIPYSVDGALSTG